MPECGWDGAPGSRGSSDASSAIRETAAQKRCFAARSVTLRTVVASLADGDSVDQILADFPSLKAGDVRAALDHLSGFEDGAAEKRAAAAREKKIVAKAEVSMDHRGLASRGEAIFVISDHLVRSNGHRGRALRRLVRF